MLVFLGRAVVVNRCLKAVWERGSVVSPSLSAIRNDLAGSLLRPLSVVSPSLSAIRNLRKRCHSLV